MIEQQDVRTVATVPSMPPGRALSNEARASLESIRVAQEAARLRARRQTVRTRIWFMTVIAAVSAVAVVSGSRLAGRRHARPQAAATPRPAPIAPEPTAPAIGSPVPKALVADTRISPVAVDEKTAVVEEKTAAIVGPEAGCDTALIRRAPWRLSSQACARAFDADPSNARLALAIAHAEHAHGSISEAAQWAKRALALDPSAAEAYVLIARADGAKGRREEARAAYRRYLELAPRGWHQDEARAAVPATRPTAPPEPAGAR